jgi:DNA-binding MarR family transcriptional regulator
MPKSQTSNRQRLIGEVRGAMRRLSIEIDGLDQRAAEHFGISRTDLRVIDNLHSTGPLMPSQLARAVGLTSGGLSIALERLERIGYIKRSQHPQDRRSVLVEATDAVVPFETAVFAALGRRMNRLLAGYGDEELQTIKDYLEHAASLTAASAPARASDAASLVRESA